MHARIATARVKPGTASAVQNGWQELLASYQDTGVCHGLISLMSADNVAVTLTLWESSEAADAVAAALREKAQAVFAEVLLPAASHLRLQRAVGHSDRRGRSSSRLTAFDRVRSSVPPAWSPAPHPTARQED